MNGDGHSAVVDRVALDAVLRQEGEDFFRRVTEQGPHLFAASPLFVSAAQIEQMRTVIAAIEQVVALPAWREAVLAQAPEIARHAAQAQGVFLGYDFHLNADGAHLIEINTNAGGAFLNALLLRSQQAVAMPGEAAAPDDPEQIFLDMFRNEWRLQRGHEPLRTVAIVDESPATQFLYPEFVLAQRMFERAGVRAWILEPSELEVRAEGLYHAGQKLDLVYNRLTDFYFQHHAKLHAAFQDNDLTVITPHPRAYALYAGKYNLALLTDADSLRAMGVEEAVIAVLQAGIPQTRVVRRADRELWWQQRKHWFFKPATGYGSKGVYRGEKLTHRVFEEILEGSYVAQRLVPPGERVVTLADVPTTLKYDMRCYVYGGEVQLVTAALYQGQTHNARTPGGGFSMVRIVG
ncbi:MAG: hypothetical protein HY306_00385 [Nitrosomonadales bacterium]|nr:hypothetical protein [Nitrosomonadales bacterium]